jgi:Tfp pilus assembly protein PilN
MRALALDYRRDHEGLRWIGFLLLVVAVGAAGGLAVYYRQITEQIAAADTRVREIEHLLRRESVVTQQSGGDAQKVALEMKGAHEVVMQIDLPWEDLFRAVESSPQTEVALLSIDPDAKQQRLKLTAEARNLPAMLDYVRYLQQQGSLSDIYLQSHQVQRQDPERPVRFVLIATWKTRQ